MNDPRPYNYTGYYTYHYPNEKIMCRLHYVNGLANGLFMGYYSTGKITSKRYIIQ